MSIINLKLKIDSTDKHNFQQFLANAHVLFGKEKQFYKVTAFFKLKLFHVELLQNDRFVIQLNMFLLPYVLALNFDFLTVLDI